MHYLLVSIHAPREGCDAASMAAIIALCGFQFTHPGRGATNSGCSKFELLTVSIHAPREGCDLPTYIDSLKGFVSIHAPREGCDSSVTLCREVQLLFQFTHPGRGATVTGEIDLSRTGFNSRTPGGVRQLIVKAYTFFPLFQFTHPGRGATVEHRYILRIIDRFNSRTPGGVRR